MILWFFIIIILNYDRVLAENTDERISKILLSFRLPQLNLNPRFSKKRERKVSFQSHLKHINVFNAFILSIIASYDENTVSLTAATVELARAS